MRYLLALCVFVNTVQAAPIPKQPQPKTQIDLVGVWTFDWGGMPTGWISIQDDGTFWYKHGVDAKITHMGTWKLLDNKLTLRDNYYDSDWNLGMTTTWVFFLEEHIQDLCVVGRNDSNLFNSGIMLSHRIKCSVAQR